MYISRNLEQWNAFLATLQTAFEQGKAQDLLTLLLTPDERDAVEKKLATGCVAFLSRNPGVFHLFSLYPCSLLRLYGTAKNRTLITVRFQLFNQIRLGEP